MRCMNWLVMVLVVGTMVGVAGAQDPTVLLLDADRREVVVAAPQPDGQGYTLLIHGVPAVFADLEQGLVAMPELDSVDVDGTPVLRLFLPDGTPVEFSVGGARHPVSAWRLLPAR